MTASLAYRDSRATQPQTSFRDWAKLHFLIQLPSRTSSAKTPDSRPFQCLRTTQPWTPNLSSKTETELSASHPSLCLEVPHLPKRLIKPRPELHTRSTTRPRTDICAEIRCAVLVDCTEETAMYCFTARRGSFSVTPIADTSFSGFEDVQFLDLLRIGAESNPQTRPLSLI